MSTPSMRRIDSEFSFTVIEVAYEYAFLKRDNYELAGSIGLHYTDMSASLKARAEIFGRDARRGHQQFRQCRGAIAGHRPAWHLGSLAQLLARRDRHSIFALSIDEYDGNLQDYRVLVTWQPKKWLGIGLGYNQFSVDVDVDKDDFNGSLDWTYSGPMIFYSASF